MTSPSPVPAGCLRAVLRTAGILCIPFILVGIGMVLWGFTMMMEHRAFVREAAHVPGIVVGFTLSDSSDGPMSCAVVEFEAGAEKRQFTDKACFSISPYSEGEKIEVLYDRARPEHAEIDSAWNATGVWFLMAGGAGFALLGTLGTIAPPWLAGRIGKDAPSG